MRHIKVLINLFYGLFGLYIACSSFIRLWDEGTFGNESYVLFIIMIGPYIGFSSLFSGLSLAAGQTMELLNRKSGIGLSRISFGFAILVLIIHYFIYGGTYIWNEVFDFVIFSLLTLFFYSPVIFRWNYLKLKPYH